MRKMDWRVCGAGVVATGVLLAMGVSVSDAAAQVDAAAEVNEGFGTVFTEVKTVFGGLGALVFLFAIAGKTLLDAVTWLRMIYIMAFGAIIGVMGPILDAVGFQSFT